MGRLLVLISILLYHQPFVDSQDTCHNGTVSLEIDIETDISPQETTWHVQDDINSIIFSGGPYESSQTLFHEHFCIDPLSCMQFTIFDSGQDGILNVYGSGWFRVSYKGSVFFEGAKFEDSAFIRFGDLCPSLEPSTSSAPSISHFPTILSRPYTGPSVSTKPTPIWTSSQVTIPDSPTQKPTNTAIIEFPPLDKYGRRRFPDLEQSSEKSYNIQVPSDCTLGTPGCIAHPKTAFVPPPLPDWFGTLHFRHPSCELSRKRNRCDLNVPASRNAFDFNLQRVSFEFGDPSVLPTNIPRNELATTAVELGDFNGDGFMDIIFAEYGNPNQLIMNDGNNGYLDPIDLPGGEQDTKTIALGDVNSDGLLDIVVGNYGYPNQLLLNNGNGVFLLSELPGGSGRTYSLAIGDVDANNHLDIAVADIEHGNFLLLNMGSLNFEIVYFPDSSSSRSVAMADIDNDGKIDLILGCWHDTTNKILLNQGNKTFVTRELTNSGFHTVSIAAGDIDGDGNVDIVVGNIWEPSFVLVNLGDGINFEKAALPNLVEHIKEIVLADLDGNGLLDILTAEDGAGDTINEVFMNKGHFEFEQEVLSRYSSVSLAAVNIPQTGQMLVVFGNIASDRLFMISSNEGDQFHALDLPYVANDAEVGDFNGDGLMDFVMQESHPPHRLQLVLNSRLGLFDTVITIGSIEGFDLYDIAVGDIDDDNLLDVVVGSGGAAGIAKNFIFFNNGDNTFTSVDLPGGDHRTSNINLAYIDNDRLLDIIVANLESPNQLLYNFGNRSFEVLELPGGVVDTANILPCDLDGDYELDLVVGNYNWPNQVLYNRGNRSFSLVDLPGGDTYTSAITVADMDNDTLIDIILGNNEKQPNELLLNRGNGSFTIIGLEGYIAATPDFLSVADLNFDGLLDIVVAYYQGVNQILWNKGNNVFKSEDLPGGGGNTCYAGIADFDDDGLLDIILSNCGDEMQILRNNVFRYCHEGGTRLHEGSWCFSCPSYMGRPMFLGEEVSTCVECMADYVQSELLEECNYLPCPYGHRLFGEDNCAYCPDGTFFDNTVVRDLNDHTTWNSTRCRTCPPGHYSDQSILEKNKCLSCPPGSYQPNNGEAFCIACEKGFFQPDSGQESCQPCTAGGFCNSAVTCGGGFQSCPLGTFNDREGQSEASACSDCPSGTFSSVVGATSVAACEPCSSGSFTNTTGEKRCQQCSPGTYQPDEGQASCNACEPGTYADEIGFVSCIRCPYRLDSEAGSNTCTFCQEGFYLSDKDTDLAAIYEKPDDHCKICPSHAVCPRNTTLQTLVVPLGFWRDSLETSTLYECDNSACQGTSSQRSSSGRYCINGHTGPLCQVCLDESDYFNSSSGKCKRCPSLWRLAILPSIIMAMIGVFMAVRFIISLVQGCEDSVHKLHVALTNIGIQGKLKIVISFYQIINALNDVYGVIIDERLKGWIDFLSVFNFGLFEISSIPGNCIGSMSTRLILETVSPFIITMLCFGGILSFTLYSLKKRKRNEAENADNRIGSLWLRLLTISIIIFYLVIPFVCKKIFEAKKCRPFDSNDNESLVSSYLVADWSIRCDDSNDNYLSLLRIFWVVFALWLVLVPLFLFGILMGIRRSVQSQQITALAEACSFLWRDYKKEVMYWEVLELIRKMFLTGLIMFVDTQEGSNKILRLIIASFFSTFYLGILLYARPYQRNEDLLLALVSNLLLASCFALGIVIQQCNISNETCHALVGLSLNSYKASVLAVILMFTMLVISATFLFIIGLNYVSDPTIKLVSTGQKPALDMAPDCMYHAFVSHIWSSGQDKTHALVRKLNLYMPGIKIWLDVMNLTNMDNLEASVEESSVFILMYTDGYFNSKNCRREIEAAVALRKPIIILYEGDDSVVDTIKESCLKYCTGQNPSANTIVHDIFEEEPLLWLGASSRYFSTASVKELSERILRKLPYYIQHPRFLRLGLRVKDELKPVSIPNKCRLFFSTYNTNAEQIALEVKAMERNHNVSTENIGDISKMTDFVQGNNFFVLYLDDKVFSDREGKLEKQVKSAIQRGLKIILVHEKDIDKGAKPFDIFFAATPRILLASPYNLFSDIAINLYSFEKYREISLRLILCKMRDSSVDSSVNIGWMRSVALRKTNRFLCSPQHKHS